MNKQPKSETIITPLQPTSAVVPRLAERVVLVNPLSKGNLGKTTFYEYLAACLDESQISWAGANMDSRHRSFQAAHPTNVVNYFQEGVQAVDEYHPVFREVRRNHASVFLIDQRAQADEAFLQAAQRTNFLKSCQTHGIRVVPICMAINDLDYLRNVMAAVAAFAESGIKRWIVVSHPDLHKNDVFMRTALRRRLEAENAAFIEMLWLSHPSMQLYSGLNASPGGPYSFRQAVKHPIMLKDDLSAAELEANLLHMGKQFRQYEDLLLPAGVSFSPLSDLSSPSNGPVSPSASWSGQDDLSAAFRNER